MIEPKPKRILLITRNLPPLMGGMERLNWHIAEELAKTSEVKIIGPQGSATLAPAGVMTREAPIKPAWKFLAKACVLARDEARHWKPDLVVAGSGLTAPVARYVAQVCGAQTAVYVHGLDVAVRHVAYRIFWLHAIRHMDRVIANSNATARLCHNVGIEPTRTAIVHPGVELPNVASALSIAADFRSRHGMGNRPLLVSVGRLSERKGLLEFVTQALPLIVAKCPDVLFLIVGEAPRNALHARAQTPREIQEAADKGGVGGHLRFMGEITDYKTLGSVYSAADVHVFPVREIMGDPEGFGMVAIEAAAHGLPTVAFATGGIVDAVDEGHSGRLVEPDDYVAFAEAVLRSLKERNALRSSCHDFARRFSWPVFGTQLRTQLLGAESTG